MVRPDAAAEPTEKPLLREEHPEPSPQDSVPIETAVKMFTHFAIPRVLLYSAGDAAVVTMSYLVAYCILQTAAPLWHWLDPPELFRARLSPSFLILMELVAYPVYFLRVVVAIFPAFFLIRSREWDEDSMPYGQRMSMVYQWWTRKIAPIPPVVLSILDVALVFAVGMMGVVIVTGSRLDRKHAAAVAALAAAWYAVFRVIVGILRSPWRRAVRAKDGDAREDSEKDVEKGYGATIPAPQEEDPTSSESNPNHKRRASPEQRRTVLLDAVYIMISFVFGLSLWTYCFYWDGHILLANLQVLRAASPGNTMWIAKLGASFVLIPCAVTWMFPVLFILDEIAAGEAGTTMPIMQWWARKTKPVPPAVWLVLGIVGVIGLLVAAGPVGVWLSQFWPSGEPGLDAWHACIVGVAAFAFLVEVTIVYVMAGTVVILIGAGMRRIVRWKAGRKGWGIRIGRREEPRL